MEQKYVLGIVALAMVALLGIGMASAFGFGFGNGKIGLTDEEKTQMQEKRDAMKTAIENKDYATWKSLMQEQIAEMQAQITEENFNSIVEQHQQMQEARASGNYTQGQGPQGQMGLEGKRMGGQGKGKGMGNGNCNLAE